MERNSPNFTSYLVRTLRDHLRGVGSTDLGDTGRKGTGRGWLGEGICRVTVLTPTTNSAWSRQLDSGGQRWGPGEAGMSH